MSSIYHTTIRPGESMFDAIARAGAAANEHGHSGYQIDCERCGQEVGIHSEKGEPCPGPWLNIWTKIVLTKEYEVGVTYGKPRTGHAEGRVINHLRDLDVNLDRMRPLLSEEEYWKLRVLIHVHDTCKYWAKRDSAIMDPKSHASLARKFLEKYTDNEPMLEIVQHHDEGYALYKQFEAKGFYNEERFRNTLADVEPEIELFLLFTILDGYTPSKEHERIVWFVRQVDAHRKVSKKVWDALDLFDLT